MVKRVKHLLEAFQQTGVAARPSEPQAPSSQPPHGHSLHANLSAAPRASARPALSQVWITHGIVLCVGLLIGVFAGRFTRTTEAAGPDASSNSGAASAGAANPNESAGAGAQGSTGPGVLEPRLQGESGSGAFRSAGLDAGAPDGSVNAPRDEISAALRDKSNRYTLLAITYTNSPANHDLARSTASYLRTKQLPACDPVLRGKTLCVLVGAAASKAQLQALQTRLRDTLGPSGRGQDFTTAYPVEIDTYIAR